MCQFNLCQLYTDLPVKLLKTVDNTQLFEIGYGEDIELLLIKSPEDTVDKICDFFENNTNISFYKCINVNHYFHMFILNADGNDIHFNAVKYKSNSYDWATSE